MSKKVPIRKGLFTDDCAGSLLGKRCKNCNQILPPLAPLCYNCSSEELDEIPLSKRGKLYSYTVIYVPHPHLSSPYAVGVIDLPEGIKIYSPIKNWQNKPLQVDMDVELVIGKAWEEDDKEIFAFAFQPV
jgi:uncharacterized OB-fold protein